MSNKSPEKIAVPSWIAGAGLFTGFVLAYLSKSPRMFEEVHAALKEFHSPKPPVITTISSSGEQVTHEIVILGLNGKPFGGQPS